MTVGESPETRKYLELQEQSATPCDSSDAPICPVLQGVSGTFRVPGEDDATSRYPSTPGVEVIAVGPTSVDLEVSSVAGPMVQLSLSAEDVARLMLLMAQSS